MNTWSSLEGAPYPLGVSYIPEENAYNFALYSKSAAQVKLLLYQAGEYKIPVASFQLDAAINKSQRIWHIRLQESALNDASYFAFQVQGTMGDDPDYWHMFDREKILIDPYAKEVFFPPEFSRRAASRNGNNAGQAPLGFICTGQEEFDWQDDKPVRHTHDLIIYEMHVKGFTHHPNSKVADPNKGTFAGVTEKIPYLKELGITAVELLPVHQFDPKEDNYWGYMTLNFFAPHHQYTADPSPGGAIREFKTMVRELHKAGIEVILDVVFNHTTEGDTGGPTYSMKGIDNSTYYLLGPNQENPFLNYSGTGNTLRTDHPAVQQLIMDALRYWVKEMHVDGFRFDLASVFARKSDGTIGEAPIFAHIAAEPDLANVRLIAEPWDAGGLYQLGRAFPGMNWMQWNGGFRDDIRKFVKSDAGMVAEMMHRLYGSDRLFPDDPYHAYHPFQSVNYITSHDGFTLYDLVSYNQKHNHANGYQNTDGHEPNLSWNCGWEGDEGMPAAVLDLRKRQAKNFFTLLMLANGTPMFLAGDEFLHTQNGNNNPFNQDNETSWLNWDRQAGMQDHFNFVKEIIAFRKSHPTLSRSRFWKQDITWFGVNGGADFSSESRCLAFFLSGQLVNDRDFYVMINMHWEGINFQFMVQGPWNRIINTFYAPPNDFLEDTKEVINQGEYLVGPRSVVVFSR